MNRGGKKRNIWNWIGTTECLARRSTGNHRNTRELWRVTISESVFCRQSWLSQLHQLFWLCDERARLWCRSCYTPSPPPGSPTVTLIHCVTLCNPQLWHSLRPDYVMSQSMDVPSNVKVLTYVASPFQVGRSRSESKYKDFFYFSSGGPSFKWGNIRPVYWCYFQLTYATCSLVA